MISNENKLQYKVMDLDKVHLRTKMARSRFVIYHGYHKLQYHGYYKSVRNINQRRKWGNYHRWLVTRSGRDDGLSPLARVPTDGDNRPIFAVNCENHLHQRFVLRTGDKKY
jgi:hypothetical protein